MKITFSANHEGGSCSSCFILSIPANQLGEAEISLSLKKNGKTQEHWVEGRGDSAGLHFMHRWIDKLG